MSVYQRFYHIVRDNQGNVISGATCTVYNVGTDTLSTIYDPGSDDSNPQGISNPFVTGADGKFGFFALDGEYDIQIKGGSLATQTFRVTLSTADAGVGAVASADLANTSSLALGDALVGVKRTVTGAVATTEHVVNENRTYNAVSDFACPTDGTSDCSAAIHAAIAGVPSGSTIEFPPGTFKMNITLDKFVHLKGAGQTATIFKPYTTPGCIIQQVYYAGIGVMQLAKIEGIQFSGAGTGVVDTGVRCGHATYTANDENTGKLHFDHCTFVYFDKCVSRPYGSIYVVFTNCEFSVANYHVWSTSNASPVMHSGCLFFDKCHREYANLACVYMDSSVVGSGQVVSTGCIDENNPGFVYFVKNFNNTGDTGFISRDCWQEANYSAANVTIDAVVYTPPKYAYFANANAVDFEGTPVGPMTLVNAQLRVRRCNIDPMTTGSPFPGAANPVLDADSSLILEDVEQTGSGSSFPSVNSTYSRSLLWTSASGRCLSAVRHRLYQSNGHNASLVARNDCTQVTAFGGTGAKSTVNDATDGVLFPTCQQLTVLSTDILDDSLTPANYIAVTAGKFYVYLVTYKLVSGPMPFIYYPVGTPFGVFMPSSSTWITMASIVKAPSTAGNLQLRIAGNGGTSVIKLGGYCMLEFATRQDALIFLDSGAFPGPATPFVANGSVATVMSSVGPTGAQTAIQGWEKIYVGGVARYRPYW